MADSAAPNLPYDPVMRDGDAWQDLRFDTATRCRTFFGKSGTGRLDCCYQPVPPPRNSLDVAGPLSAVAQRCAKPVYGRVYAMVELNECSVGSDSRSYLVASHYLSRMLEKNPEYRCRMLL